MKRRFISFTVVVLTSIIFTKSALADMPVIDWAEIMKTMQLLEEAKNQLEEIKNLKQTALDQLGFLKQNISGNFGYGNLWNTQADLYQRQWSNDNWVDVLNRVNTDKTSAFYQAQQAYAKMYPVANANQIDSTLKEGDLSRIYYQQESSISRAALAASSYNYNEINRHIQNIHDILAKLESQTSEKAAIDLNTRLVAELSFIQLESLKQQNIQIQLAATEAQKQVNGMSDESKFMQWNP